MTRNVGKKWRILGVIGALCVPALVTAALSLPYAFKAGDPIRSAEVNANFEALRSRLDALSSGTPVRPVLGTFSLAGVVSALPIRGFTQAIDVPVAPAQAGTGKPALSDVQVTRDAGDGSPPLNLGLNQQKHFATADIVLGSLSVHLTDVVLTHVTVSGVQAARAEETIGLTYQAVEWTWTPATGTPKVVSFDRAKGIGAGAGTLPASLAYYPPGVTAGAAYVPITSYSHDMGCPTPTCKVTHGPLTVQKLVGAETLDAFSVAANTKHTQAMDLTWFTSATAASHSLSITDFVVSNVSLSTADDGTLRESDSYVYSTISWTAGKVTAGWDVTKNIGL